MRKEKEVFTIPKAGKSGWYMAKALGFVSGLNDEDKAVIGLYCSRDKIYATLVTEAQAVKIRDFMNALPPPEEQGARVME